MDTLVAFSTQTGFVTRPLVLFFVLLGLALGLRRTAFARGSQVAIWLAIAVPLLAWYLLMNWVGQSDLYQSAPWTRPSRFWRRRYSGSDCSCARRGWPRSSTPYRNPGSSVCRSIVSLATSSSFYGPRGARRLFLLSLPVSATP